MEVINGEWIMKGLPEDSPDRLKSYSGLEELVVQTGFLPLFSNEVRGFSAEEHCSAAYWWSGDKERDPWVWREIIAERRQVAYGKFFGGKAGFISLEWLPYFANFRRGGYDFDSRWEDGLANRREKLIMDKLIGHTDDGEPAWTKDEILTCDLKKLCGFGKNGEKNFQGIVTGLMMQTYLVTVGFRRRISKKGKEYGMPVSVMLPPEAVWGYGTVTAAYSEAPEVSRQRIIDRVRELCPDAGDEEITALIGKRPYEN